MIKFEFKNIKILQEFSDFNGSYMVFYSVYKGVKKSMDLWIKDSKINDFTIFCNKHNLHLKYDVKFIESNDYSIYKNVVGSKNLTTTKTIGESVNSNNSGLIHCFISKEKEYVEELYKYGWYPVVVGNRVIYKSFHDLSEFGEKLGYPSCCTKFFFEKNDWRYYNFPYEIFKNSKKFDYRCNPFWKDYLSISYIYHMPCNFGCEETISYSQKIIKYLSKEDPNLVKQIEKYLTFPILSIREQKIYAFEGVISKNNQEINYKNFFHLGKKQELDLSSYLNKGNKIKIEGSFVNIYYEKTLIYSYDCEKSDEIEIPFIIQFNNYKNV